MEYSKNQEKILQRLKTRGPQSVKIMSNQLDMTTMGVRQHLTELGKKGVVKQTQEEKQTRGRPPSKQANSRKITVKARKLGKGRHQSKQTRERSPSKQANSRKATIKESKLGKGRHQSK